MRVGVIGVGNIGAAVASRLLDVGATVVLNTRTPAKCAPLVERGARIATTPREAALGADFVVTSLNGADIVESVVFGADGVASAAAHCPLLVDLSSIDPARTRAMAVRLQESGGNGWVDAPLSGGAPAASKGELVLMVGGSASDVARARPLFDVLARRATHLGPSGAGQTVKLINQILCAAGLVAVAEAVRFAENVGVDAARIPEALADGRADSRILQEFMAKFARRDYSPTGRIANLLKDLEAVSAASPQAAQLPLTARLLELHREIVAAGFGDADSTAYVDFLAARQSS